jgi:hypothetical protein
MLPPCLLILRRPPSQRAVLPTEPRNVCSRGLKIGSDGRQIEMLAFAQTKSSRPARFDAGMLKNHRELGQTGEFPAANLLRKLGICRPCRFGLDEAP